jgi:hypothetical protein
MNRPTVLLIAIFIACTVLALFPAGAASIQMTPSSVTVQKSATAEISLVLDDAPSGLAGYDLVIRLSNPGIAEITEITYPSWASLFNTTRNADGSVRISGVDISRQVSPGATAVPLATLKIRGIYGGSSSIALVSVNMDADGGDLITPVLPTGQIIVPGGSGSSSGGGGGGGGTVYQVTSSPTSSTPTPSPTATQIQPTPTLSPGFTEDTAYPSMTPTNEPVQPGGYSATGLPEAGIPWTWILGGIIVLGAMIFGAFIAWRREGEEG